MSSQTSTGQVVGDANAATPVQGGDDSVLTPELIERVGKLAPGEQNRLGILIAGGLGHDLKETEEDRQYWREEIARRVESIKNGTAKFYTLEETLAHMDEAIAESESQ